VDYQINYAILIPGNTLKANSQELSLLHGFSKSLLRRSSWIREIVQKFPPTVIEALSFSRYSLQLRVSALSYFRVFPLLVGDLSIVKADEFQSFWILLCDSETIDAANNWSQTQKLPVLILNSETYAEISTTPQDQIKSHILLVCRELNALGFRTPFDQYLQDSKTRPEIKVPHEYAGHNLTVPNELMLMSVGVRFSGQMPSLAGTDDKHVERIIGSADHAAQILEAIPSGEIFRISPIMPTVILSCPAVYKHAFKARPPAGMEREPFFRMLRVLQKLRTYSIFEEEAEIKNLLENPISKYLLKERTDESSAYTDAVSARAASYLSPVLRLPPSVNHTNSELKALADCLRGANPTPRKIAKVVGKFSEKLASAVPAEFLDRLDQPHSGIKLISDAPLEWLPIRNFPLALRHITSRIPATPGNLSFSQTLPRDQLELTTDAFSTTLVIRSFKPDDPLRGDLETAIKHYKLNDGSLMPIEFQDVANRDQLVEAINRFDGALMIYDGHGRHSNVNDIGVLNLVEEDVNSWELQKKIKSPPILFICGCDTHAIGASHVSPANGFLAAGARAVIGTALPIHSKVAAIFTARLLYNIYGFLSNAVNEQQMSVRWDYVFSTVQRMMFVSDFFRMIGRHDLTEAKWGRELQIEMSLKLLDREYNWYEDLLTAVSRESQLNAEEIEQLRTKELALPECLKYFHLGNPDLIVIRPRNLSPVSPESLMGRSEA
jgi:hypothetical protein